MPSHTRHLDVMKWSPVLTVHKLPGWQAYFDRLGNQSCSGLSPCSVFRTWHGQYDSFHRLGKDSTLGHPVIQGLTEET